MEWVIWLGTALSLLGLAGIVYSAIKVRQLRKSTEDDEALRQGLWRLLPINLGALTLSILGLGVIVAGIFLSA